MSVLLRFSELRFFCFLCRLLRIAFVSKLSECYLSVNKVFKFGIAHQGCLCVSCRVPEAFYGTKFLGKGVVMELSTHMLVLL